MNMIGEIANKHIYKNKKGEEKPMDMNVIPNDMEKYMAFMLGKHLFFIDSYQFMSSSLDGLVSNLPDDAFKYTSEDIKDNQKLNLMKQMGVYLEKMIWYPQVLYYYCSRVRGVWHSELLYRNQNHSQDKKEWMVLVFNYHPALLKSHRILRKLQVLVEWLPLLKSILPELLIVSFRWPRNTKYFLVRGKLELEIQSDKGMFGCGKVKCKIYKFVKTGYIFESTVEKKSFHINHSSDCDSSGVVYLITCKRCAKQYVGSTITEFRKRFNNHKSLMNRYGEVLVENIYMHIFLKKAI